MKNKVEFTNDITLAAKGIDDVFNINRLIEKNYKLMIEDKMMGVYDSSVRSILKAQMSQNKTSKIKLNAMEHKCLATIASRDE